tara:strand:+ start:2756 stop:3163 length:408 start_codon:yes stop_codon:yes gene_type:complete
MPNKYDVVFQQRDPNNTRFLERVVSGSNLIIQTNAQGVLVGSITPPPISGSIISASGLYVDGPSNLGGDGSSPTVVINLTGQTGSFDSMFINPNGSVAAPLSSSDYGLEGELRTDNNFLYVYLNGAWRRAPYTLF